MFSIEPDDGLDDMANNRGRDAEKDETRKELPQGQYGTESESEEKKRTIRGFRWVIVCVSLYVTCFLYGLDTTIAADVQGPVTEAFGQVDQLAWIGAGFPLGSVCVILLLGTLYNSFNIKLVFIATVALFEAGSALCGGAPNSTSSLSNAPRSPPTKLWRSSLTALCISN
jgi:MFS family permease